MKIYVICPVRKMTTEHAESVRQEVLKLEAEGHTVHWPPEFAIGYERR